MHSTTSCSVTAQGCTIIFMNVRLCSDTASWVAYTILQHSLDCQLNTMAHSCSVFCFSRSSDQTSNVIGKSEAISQHHTITASRASAAITASSASAAPTIVQAWPSSQYQYQHLLRHQSNSSNSKPTAAIQVDQTTGGSQTENDQPPPPETLPTSTLNQPSGSVRAGGRENQ